jgi:Flp pilus assembly pilin Flp
MGVVGARLVGFLNAAGVGRHRSRRTSRRGQGVVEYGLILSLSALLAVTLLVVFGGTLSAVLKAVGDAIDAAS